MAPAATAKHSAMMTPKKRTEEAVQKAAWCNAKEPAGNEAEETQLPANGLAITLEHFGGFGG